MQVAGYIRVEILFKNGREILVWLSYNVDPEVEINSIQHQVPL